MLCFGNKVTIEIIQLSAEHDLLFIEYKIQTETGDKHGLYNLKKTCFETKK